MKINLDKILIVAAIAGTGCVVDIDPFDSLTDEAGDGDGDTTDDGESSDDGSTTDTDDDVGTDESTGDGDGDTTETTADTTETTADTTADTTETTGGDNFTCTDGTTVPLEFACDGEADCADNSDEVTGCGIRAFNCESNGYEIPAEWVCDTEPDCEDASDENNCG